LVIEDETTLRNLLEEWLAVGGYDVEAVDSYSNALTALARQTFELIVTDTMDFVPLQGKSRGFDALTRAAEGTPVVLFTGYQDTADLNMAEMGLSAVCHKPYFEELRTAIQVILNPRTAA
jgi:CheY-like chemotaxis protein